MMPEVLIRECKGLEEFEACVRLQTEVWGYDGRDTIPQREFVVIQRIGGQVVGAFDLSKAKLKGEDASSMIGFAMSMPGIRGGFPYLHSHMLAVLPEYRNLGIGRKLKLAQREEALQRGIGRMEWTFDPLETKNAYLNIAKLGAVVRSYTPNFYGVFSSRLQAGLPTDRLHAEWWMDSPRVGAILKGAPLIVPEIEKTIIVPWKIRDLKDSTSGFAQAESIQTEIRSQFLAAFASGLTVVGFSRELSANASANEANISDGISGGQDGVYQLAEWREP